VDCTSRLDPVYNQLQRVVRSRWKGVGSVVPEQCIRLFVLTAGKNAKSHSSPPKEDQYTAEIATRSIGNSR